MTASMTTQEQRQHRNADEFMEDIQRYSDAACGIIVIRTREIVRCANILQDLAIQEETEYNRWTCVDGWQRFPQPINSAQNDDHRRPLALQGGGQPIVAVDKAFERVLKEGAEGTGSDGGFFVMVHPHFHFEKPLIQQLIRNIKFRTAYEWRGRLFMIVPPDAKIPSEIEDDIVVVDFKTPSHAELMETWSTSVDGIEPKYRPEFTEEQLDTIVQNATGMTDDEFATAFSIATIRLQQKYNDGEDVTPDDYIASILEQKIEVIKKTDILELMPVGDMNQIGGLDLLKEWMRKRSLAYSDEARAFGLELPKGVLCVGPPGSGKTLFAKAAASIFKTPCIKLDVGRIHAKFVGESESRMRTALQLVEAMSPCVLLLDEIDKGFAGSSGSSDSGVSARVLGTFLTWMQERDNDKAPVFVVMTANNVTGLPAELMRKGRIDEIFAVTFPSEVERKLILDIHLTKRGHTVPDDMLIKIAKRTDGWVGAELEGLVIETLVESFSAKDTKPKLETFLRLADATTPLSRSQKEKVEFMNEWAKNNAKPASTGMSFETPAPAGHRALRTGRLPIRPKGPIRGGKSLDG